MGFDQKMQVSIHEEVCMNAHGKLFGILVQILKEALFIFVFSKDGVILISAADHMINATG